MEHRIFKRIKLLMCSELENIQKEKKSLFGQNRRRIDDHFANEPDLNVEFNVASKLSPPKARKGKKKRKKVLKIDPKNIQMLLPVEPLPAMDWFEFSTANVETPDELQAPFMPSDLTPEVQQEFNDVYCDQVRQRTVTRFNPTIDDRTLVDLTKRCLRALTNKKEIPVLINVLSQGDTSLGTPEMAAACINELMDGECLECLIKAKCTIHQPPIFKVPGEINKNKLPGNKGARAQRRRRTPPPKRERSTNYFSLDIKHKPCYHPGTLCTVDPDCLCYQNQQACEDLCKCATTCRNRLRSCSCSRPCWMNNKCPCFRYHRECTDKCERCRKKQVSKKGCRNTRIQNNDGPRIVVAESNISGWGAFLFENVKKNDFICEYVGEIITQSEVSRRSVVSNARGASYFFDLNPDQTIDASRRGNQARFVNHSNQPNCVIKKIMSNGTPKIVIIAKEKMVKGTELFINYMENFPTQGFCTSTEHGSVPVKELHEKFIHHGWLHYDPGNEIQEPDVVAPESSPT